MSTIVVSGSTPAEVSVTIPQVNNIVVTPPDVQSVSVSVVGAPGAPGQGLVSGGSENQFLQKNSATDYDTKWSAYTLPAADGDDGQVLTTDGAATVTFAYPKTIAEEVKNVSGGPLLKGTPVHVTGSVGNLAEVIAADAATNYPAHFVLNEDLADDQEGLGIAIGFINNVDVPDASIYTEGQTVYLGASGGWTTTKPTGANAIQNLGIIIKVNVTGGGPAGKISGIIMGAGRANDVPNIATGNIWAGNADGVATATDTAYIDIANRRVGIGTVTPTTPLHVVGNIRVNASTDHVYSNRFTAVANADVQLRSYDGYDLILNGDTGDNVGIGTTSPLQKLHLKDGADVNLQIGAVSSELQLKATNDADSAYIPMILRASEFNILSGNVGIGTTTPTYKLDVSGEVRADAYRIDLSGTTERALSSTGTNSIQVGDAGVNDIRFKNASGTPVFMSSSGNVGVGTITPARKLEVSFAASTYGARFTRNDTTGSSLIEFANSAGVKNVTGYNAGVDGYTIGTSADTHLTVRSTGNVGIGTTSPGGRLHLSGSTGSSILRMESPSANTLAFNHYAGYSTLRDLTLGNNRILFLDSGDTTFSSNIGIGLSGSTAPSAKLDVAGLANINDGSNNVMISSRNTAMAASSGSNNTAVGDVAGFINASGNNNSFFGRAAGYYSTGYNNVLLGMEAGYGAATSTFSNTVAVGYQALYDLTTGASNTAIGYQAADALTTESSNTVIGYAALGAATSVENATGVGYRALDSSTGNYTAAVGYRAGQSSGFGSVTMGSFSGQYAAGDSNVLVGYAAGQGSAGASTFVDTTAVGHLALQDLTTGTYNTAVGYQAGTNINIGGANTAVGYQAGLSNTEGDNNTFVGGFAGQANTTGDNNSFFGRNAGYANTSGSVNSFLGVSAGRYNTTGYSNTFLGGLAGNQNTIGYSNSFVGVNAGYSNTSGDNNSFFGRDSGYSNSTGSGNIFIGYQAGYNETGSDKLYIANSDTSTPLIYGDFNLRAATINGDLTVSSGDFRADSIEINGRSQTSPAAGEYGAGSKIVTQFATGTVTAGVVYVASSGAWVQGDADVGSASIGMIAVATSEASATKMLIEGVIKLSSNAGFSGASAGDVLYLSNTAGELTTTAPSGTGDYVRVCGYVVNASQNEVFFSPSKEWRVV